MTRRQPLPSLAVPREGRAAALEALVESIRDNCSLDDDSLHQLLDAEPSDEARKRLAMGLYFADLITADQASASSFRLPIGDDA